MKRNWLGVKASKAAAGAITSLILVQFISPSAAATTQHEWGASYLDWTGPVLSSNSSLSQTITILETSDNTYWSMSWGWAEISDGGYMGIQEDGARQDGSSGDIAIFSIWNSSFATPGPDAWCLPFGGEGEGMSCRLAIEVEAGNSYSLQVFPATAVGPEWWGVTIVLPGDESKLIGYIKAPESNLSASSLTNFTEYFGPKLPCSSVGKASARYGVPVTTTYRGAINVLFSQPQKACGNSWMSLDKTWRADGPIMHFGGSATPPPGSKKSASFVPAKTSKFLNCQALNKVYPGGAANSKTSKNKGTKNRFRWVVDTQVYKANQTLDRDKDGIACER